MLPAQRVKPYNDSMAKQRKSVKNKIMLIAFYTIILSQTGDAYINVFIKAIVRN